MSLGHALPAALDEAHQTGARRVQVDAHGASATVDVVEVDGIGVRVRAVRVTRAVSVPIEELARLLPERVRSLPDRVAPVEVDAGLNGGVFRTPVDPVQGDYYQLDVRGRDAEVRRFAVSGGERAEADFAITRDSLGRLLDELS